MWPVAPSEIKTEASLTTTGIREVFGQFPRGVMHGQAAPGEHRVHVEPGQPGQLRGFAEA